MALTLLPQERSTGPGGPLWVVRQHMPPLGRLSHHHRPLCAEATSVRVGPRKDKGSTTGPAARWLAICTEQPEPLAPLTHMCWALPGALLPWSPAGPSPRVPLLAPARRSVWLVLPERKPADSGAGKLLASSPLDRGSSRPQEESSETGNLSRRLRGQGAEQRCVGSGHRGQWAQPKTCEKGRSTHRGSKVLGDALPQRQERRHRMC